MRRAEGSNRSFPIGRLLLASALIGLIALAVLAFRALKQDVEGYNESKNGQLYWHVAQTEVELSKFIAALSRFTVRDPTVDRQALNTQFDILWRRTGPFRSGELSDLLAEFDQATGAIPLLLSRLEGLEPAVLAIDPARPDENVILIHRFAEIHDDLSELAVRVLQDDEDRLAGVRDNLQQSSYLSLMIWGAAVVLAALLVGVMLVEARRYERTIRETEELASKAEAANRAKSRFLTMMSHELRTPMNGVLGLIALAKQTGLSDAQKRLIEQAERAGAHMSRLLGDILDFSDLQTDRLEIDNADFRVRDLGDALEDAISSAATRSGVTFSIDYSDDLPKWVIGDFARLRQALSHCCTHFIESVGARDLQIVLSHELGGLVCRIHFESDTSEHAAWAQETFRGRRDPENAEFSTDALGATIARGLVALMGGRFDMTTLSDGRTDLAVRTPAEVVQPVRDCIRLETVSDTTQLLVEAALDRRRWRIWSEAMDRSRVAAILVDPPGAGEEAAIDELRAQHPGARLIALGEPGNATLYDAVCVGPYNAEHLNRAIQDEIEEAATA